MINSIKSRATRVSRATFVKNCDLTALKRAKHPLLYRFSAPDNWSLSFWKTTFPSGEPAYYIAWSGIEHVFVRPTFDLEYEETLLDNGNTHRNPIDDKVRSARKRYGPKAALWGLMAALYATGRDLEANSLRVDLRAYKAEEILDEALSRYGSSREGEVLIGWVAHRYHLAERASDRAGLRDLENQILRAAYPVLEWTQRTRPRPNLFDYSVEDAYRESTEANKRRLVLKPPKPGAIVYRFKDGWTVQELFRRDLLVDEGNHQHNCVGQGQHGYPQRVEREEIKIYSIRDPEGYPHATMTWECNAQKLTEASGKSNDPIAPDVVPRALEFATYMAMDRVDLLKIGLLKDARGINARNLDLSFADLSGVDFTGADLRNAHLGSADLRDAKFVDANLEDASLEGANLRGADFTGAKLSRAHWAYSEYDKNTKWPDGRRPSSSMTRFADEEP